MKIGKLKKIDYFIIPKLMIKSKGGENFASRNPELNDSIIKDQLINKDGQ